PDGESLNISGMNGVVVAEGGRGLAAGASLECWRQRRTASAKAHGRGAVFIGALKRSSPA
ncbi:MAG: hypothetical protein WB723_18495, partial [Candidatus Acidiferrales bacterium]